MRAPECELRRAVGFAAVLTRPRAVIVAVIVVLWQRWPNVFTINNFHRDDFNTLDGCLLRIKVLSNDDVFGTRVRGSVRRSILTPTP